MNVPIRARKIRTLNRIESTVSTHKPRPFSEREKQSLNEEKQALDKKAKVKNDTELLFRIQDKNEGFKDFRGKPASL